MSISLMTEAFKSTAIPATQKLVLLAICDAANDDGVCYPSVSTLEAKCSLSDRAVQKAIGWLEENGVLWREFRTGRSVIYHVNDPRTWCTPAANAPRTASPATPERRSPPNDVHPEPRSPHPRTTFTPPPNHVHPTPERRSPITIKEPSKEPSRKQAAPDFGDVAPSVVTDFVAHRKAKRAPVTQTALNLIRAEAAKAGISLQEALELCCARGWTGFKAEWLPSTGRASSGVAL